MSNREAMELARDLVRGSIIEDAASRFISQVLKEAHDSRIKPLQDRIEELEAKLAEAVEALEDASQIISQCTWATMLVKGQYVDRKEAVRGYRDIIASLQGDKT